MPQQKRGLGKGLGALIPTARRGPGARIPVSRHPCRRKASAAGPPAPTSRRYRSGSITPNPRQPRQVFDEEALEELAASIGVVGLLQPVVVRRVMPGHYEIVMGERRWRACQLAGLAQIPAIVRETSDDDLLRDALIENLHREQLNPLEEAAAYQQLLDDFSATHEELARKVGRSRPHISNTIRLLNLPARVQKRVAAGVLSAGHARALLAVDDLQAQEQLAHRIVAEGLSVRAVEEIVALGAQRNQDPAQAGGQAKAGRPGAAGPRGPALGRLRHPGEGRARPAQGEDRGRVRDAGGPGADRQDHDSRLDAGPHRLSPASAPADVSRGSAGCWHGRGDEVDGPVNQAGSCFT